MYRVNKHINLSSKLIKDRKGRGLPFDDPFLKKLINIMYTENYDDISDNLVSLKTIFRNVIISGSIFLYNPLLGLISFVADKVISIKINEQYEDTVLNSYKSMRDQAKKEMDKTTDEDKKKELKKVVKKLDNKIYNLENYFNSLNPIKKKGDDPFLDDDNISNYDWEGDQ